MNQLSVCFYLNHHTSPAQSTTRVSPIAKAPSKTEPRSAQQIGAWFDGRHPIVVIEEKGEVVAFASTSSCRSRPRYAGVAELSQTVWKLTL